MPKLHIDEVYTKASTYPLLANFQNGYLNDEFKPNYCMLLQDKRNGEKTVATVIENLLYSGQEAKEDLGKTLVLARNKLTGKVRIVEHGNVELKPILNINNIKSNTELDTSYLELSRKFGSKKQKKNVEQREKLKVNVTTVKEQMHNVTVNITEDQLDLSSYTKTDTDDFYIPPINRDADRAEDVYDLYKILSKEQYEIIHSEMKEKDYNNELLPWIKDFAMKKLSDELSVLLLYASCSLKLYATLGRDILKKNFVICTSSSTLNDIILKNFTTYVGGRRNRPIQYKDKALCHALVFLLLVNNLKCDVEEISKNVKFSVRTLIVKFKLIGATIVTSGSKKIAHLKLPLASVNIGRRRQSAKF
ncbi:unnamed protein product [Chilo suppressalis]|uniref:DNA-directed RNA polymerase I subunit RPA49 n=1 Tax=Chilo suppressalis TaxID=168631 RepID=A0ABN8BA06_CHISP|nr:hypothetical protein evm_007750 [Chilo suppressalis]CAH0404146.1 unnamed protein product [Chilo suppressalis]